MPPVCIRVCIYFAYPNKAAVGRMLNNVVANEQSESKKQEAFYSIFQLSSVLIGQFKVFFFSIAYFLSSNKRIEVMITSLRKNVWPNMGMTRSSELVVLE